MRLALRHRSLLIRRGRYSYTGKIRLERGYTCALSAILQRSLFDERLFDPTAVYQHLITRSDWTADIPFWLDMPSTQIKRHGHQEPLLIIIFLSSPVLSQLRPFLPVCIHSYVGVYGDIPKDKFWVREEIRNPLQQRSRLKYKSR